MKRIPLMVKLNNRKVVVVGAGKIASKKVPLLINAGADVTVIAPNLHPDIQPLLNENKLTWVKALAKATDSFAADLLVIATNDSVLNQSLYTHRKLGQWVYIVDDPEKSDIHFPSVIERGRLVIAISTNGASPTYAKRLKDKLNEAIPNQVEEDLHFLEVSREKIVKEVKNPNHRKSLLQLIATEEFLRYPDREAALEQEIKLLRQK